jgi:hypothetical protein
MFLLVVLFLFPQSAPSLNSFDDPHFRLYMLKYPFLPDGIQSYLNAFSSLTKWVISSRHRFCCSSNIRTLSTTCSFSSCLFDLFSCWLLIMMIHFCIPLSHFQNSFSETASNPCSGCKRVFFRREKSKNGWRKAWERESEKNSCMFERMNMRRERLVTIDTWISESEIKQNWKKTNVKY